MLVLVLVTGFVAEVNCFSFKRRPVRSTRQPIGRDYEGTKLLSCNNLNWQIYTGNILNVVS